METFYNCRQFSFFNFTLQSNKNNVFCKEKPEYVNCPLGSYRIWNLARKTSKNKPFIMENQNTQTANNCRQIS